MSKEQNPRSKISFFLFEDGECMHESVTWVYEARLSLFWVQIGFVIKVDGPAEGFLTLGRRVLQEGGFPTGSGFGRWD